MTATPATVARHELVGLDCEVDAATDPGLVGLTGRVVGETARTLRVEGADGRVRQVPKAVVDLRLALDEETVVVEGERLVARPAERTERRGDSTWR